MANAEKELARSAIANALAAALTSDEAFDATCRILQTLPGYTGVYLYELAGDTLELKAFHGRTTEHTRIPAGKGICGASVLAAASVIVPDVESDPRYLACNLETKSEIVVPIFRDGLYLAQIDVDSDFRHSFDAEDESFLSEIAKRLEPFF
jgi:L-methionine (R)-S-oxide reductase